MKMARNRYYDANGHLYSGDNSQGDPLVLCDACAANRPAEDPDDPCADPVPVDPVEWIDVDDLWRCEMGCN